MKDGSRTRVATGETKTKLFEYEKNMMEEG